MRCVILDLSTNQYLKVLTLKLKVEIDGREMDFQYFKSLDVIPSPEELQKWICDSKADAIGQVVAWERMFQEEERKRDLNNAKCMIANQLLIDNKIFSEDVITWLASKKDTPEEDVAKPVAEEKVEVVEKPVEKPVEEKPVEKVEEPAPTTTKKKAVKKKEPVATQDGNSQGAVETPSAPISEAVEAKVEEKTEIEGILATEEKFNDVLFDRNNRSQIQSLADTLVKIKKVNLTDAKNKQTIKALLDFSHEKWIWSRNDIVNAAFIEEIFKAFSEGKVVISCEPYYSK